MNSVTVIVLTAFIAQVHADSMDEFANMFVEKFKQKLADRLMQETQSADLDRTTLGKAASAQNLGASNTRVAASQVATPSALRGKGMIAGCPIAVYPRGSTVTNAAQVLLGSDSGGLVFVPDTLTIKAGETVEWKNNAGFPHNIVFDEDNVPEGVAADSLGKEDYLNAPGETHTAKFDKAGTYGYYCEPHQGAGMKGKIIVQ